MTVAVERHDAVDSTQERAHELAARGAPAGTTVVAAIQTRGRGTRGQAWSSGRGGLWFSVVVRPTGAPGLEALSLRVGMALAEAIERLLPAGGPPVALKWPNDLLVADRKLGGILCETRWVGEQPAWAVVGVGINVANELDPALAGRATRLADLGATLEPDRLVEPLAEAVAKAGTVAGPLARAELDGFERRDWLRGREVTGPVPGRAAGIAPDGRLLVDQGGRAVPVAGPVIVPDFPRVVPSR